MSGHVIVCGLHGLGLRIVEQLHATGEDVVVLDDDPDARAVRSLAALGVAVHDADATTSEGLERAGLADAAAVVCVEGSELRTLRTALLVRDRRPDVRLVARLDNAAVGGAVAGDPGPTTVLEVAALAAPSVVEACLRSRVHELDVAGVRLLAASTAAPADGTLRDLYGDLAPLATTGDDGTAVCPGRDHRVAAGDRVTLLGGVDALEAAGVDTADPTRPRRTLTRRGGGREPDGDRAVAGRASRAVGAVLQVARESSRGLRWALGALLALLVVSTVVIRLGYRVESDGPPGTTAGMGVVDALYFTVESVATVGFGDYSFADQPVWLRLWAVFLMLAGIVTTAIPIAFFTDILITRRLSATAGRRRAAAATGHVVIVGLGAIGIAVTAGLRAQGRAVVVLERDPDNRFLDRAAALGVPVVFGDATSAGSLAAARVPHAAAVAVLTSDDMANIETGLAVRDLLGDRWADVPVVLRLFDRELARTVAARFDFRSVRATTELVAPWFVGAALGLDVLATFPVHQQAFLLGRIVVAAGDGLEGLAMQELSARTRVVGLRRGGPDDLGPDDPDRGDPDRGDPDRGDRDRGDRGRGDLEHPPRRDTRFGAGDEAYLVGPYEELLEVLGRRRRPSSPAAGGGPGGRARGSGVPGSVPGGPPGRLP